MQVHPATGASAHHPDAWAAQRLAVATIAVGLAVFALKSLAAWLTNSVALWSDALESVVNIAAAIAAWIAIRIAARPADAGHPFGHGKAEYLSAVTEGVLIVLAALAILHEAWGGFMAPQAPTFGLAGLVASAAATLLNGGWAVLLLRQGRRLRSTALAADGRHLLSDVVTSAGVLIGVGLAAVTGLPWLDPLLAAAVGCYVIWTGWRLVGQSVAGLMDAAPDAEVLATIRGAIEARLPARAGYHDLRARESGRDRFVEFHLTVAGTMSVARAHQLCDALEEAIAAALPDARVTIHVEPLELDAVDPEAVDPDGP